MFFLRDTWRTPVREALVMLGVGALSAFFCVRDGCRDACRPMFSSEIFSAGLGDSGFGRDPCCDVCCDGRLLRLMEALPLSERLGHTMLWSLEEFAAFAYKMSEAALLGWGMRENIRLLTMFEVASLAWGMQNSAGVRDAVPRTLCLDEMVPNGTSRPSRPARVLPPSAPPPGLPRRADGLPWAPVRDGFDQSNDIFEVVQIEPEVEEVFDLTGVARAEGWDESDLMYFVFEFGTVTGMQYCREFYEMKARQEVGEEDLPVFDLVGVAEAEGDQTELMFFVFEYGGGGWGCILPRVL